MDEVPEAAATGYSLSYVTNHLRLKTCKAVQQWILNHKLIEAQRRIAPDVYPQDR